MTPTEDASTFVRQALKRLRAADDGPAWQERKEIAVKAVRQFAATAPDEADMELVFVLAADPKPEVRKQIAEALIHLPEDAFTKLAAKLSADDNAFVKQAAERAISRKRRASLVRKTAFQKLGAVDDRLAAFEKTYGSDAARDARRIGEELFSALIRQTHHNIPNILSPIKMNIALLERQLEKGPPDQQVCKDYLIEMAKQMEHLELFLQDLSEYTRAKSSAPRQREAVRKIAIDANGMALAALANFGIPTDKVTLELQVPETLTVFVARHKILMALTHLLRNAYEALAAGAASDKRPQLTVTGIAAGNDMVQVEIKDNGPGVKAADLKILRTFAPLEKSRKPHGTGFGLATAAAYIACEGGSLSVESAPGRGFTATIFLPVDGEDDEA